MSVMDAFDVAVMLIRDERDKNQVTEAMLEAGFSKPKIIQNFLKARAKLKSSSPPPPSPPLYVETIVEEEINQENQNSGEYQYSSNDEAEGGQKSSVEREQRRAPIVVDEDHLSTAFEMDFTASNGQQYTREDIRNVMLLQPDYGADQPSWP